MSSRIFETSFKEAQDLSDIIDYPYEGICGKCGNYAYKIDKDYLCMPCKSFGVKLISITPDAREKITKFLKLRGK